MQNMTTTVASTTLSLYWREKNKLVDLLLDCASIKDPDTRDSIISDLSSEFQGEIKRNLQVSKTDVEHLVKACLDHQDGLNILLEMLLQREPKALPVLAVQRFVAQIYAFAASQKKQPQYDVLLAILNTVLESNLSGVDLERFYRACVTSNDLSQFDYPLKNTKKETLLAIVGLLQELPGTHAIPAILKFIEYLRTALRAKSLSDKLTQWADETAQAWGISEQSKKALRAAIEQENSDAKQHLDKADAGSPLPRPYILLKLKPAEKGKCKKFSAEAWIYAGPDAIDYAYAPKPDEYYTEKTIEQLLEKLVAQLNGSTNIDPKMKGAYAIDFFLPRELFSCPVESWLYRGSPLGIQCQVVIRSSEERMKDGTFRARWQSRWAKLHALAHQDEADAVCWLHRSEELDATSVLAGLMPDQIIGLGLTLVPPEIEDPTSTPELFHSLFMAGTPIALWPRHALTNVKKLPKFRAAMMLLMKQQKLPDLPELILRERQIAYKKQKQDHPGYCLALLWDDPERVPLKLPFVEPEVAKDKTYAGQ